MLEFIDLALPYPRQNIWMNKLAFMIRAARVRHDIGRCIYPDQLLFLDLSYGFIFALLSLAFWLLFPFSLAAVLTIGLRIHWVESFGTWVFIRFLWAIIVLLILLWIIARTIFIWVLAIVRVVSLLILFQHLTLLHNLSLEFFLIKFGLFLLFFFVGLFLLHFGFVFFFLNFLHVFEIPLSFYKWYECKILD